MGAMIKNHHHQQKESENKIQHTSTEENSHWKKQPWIQRKKNSQKIDTYVLGHTEIISKFNKVEI